MEEITEWVKRMEQKTGGRSTTNPVAEWLAGNIIVAVRPEWADITGSLDSAILLSQMWFWTHTPTSTDREGWFWLTQEQIYDQCRLTRPEQENARRRLRELGILEEKKQGLPRRLWFRLNKDQFFDLIAIRLDSQKK